VRSFVAILLGATSPRCRFLLYLDGSMTKGRENGRSAALAFRDDEALRVVLMAGLCPPDVQARGARIARDASGALILAPEAPLTAAVLAKLQRAGVTIDARLPEDARAVRCWAEAVALARIAVTQTPSLVLLTSSEREGLIDVAAELLRLGCERQELLATDAGGVLRVIDPPTYTIVRALDRDRGLRAYVPDPHGQEAVWTELGYRHPLAGRLVAERGQLLLVGSDGWRAIRDEGWQSLEAALELAIAAPRVEHPGGSLGERRRIELRFAPGRREPPSLWVIRRGGTAAIDRLLEYLPEDVVARLTFAAAGRNATMLSVPGMRLDAVAEGAIIIRARTGRHGPPDLSLDAEEYAPLAHMPDVYAPAGAIVEPPLRRERLRQVLGVEQGHVSWLAPVIERVPGAPIRGAFRVERIIDSAFAPLSEWADYVIHASAPALQPWQRAAVFDFAPFVSTGLEWASEKPRREEREEPEKPERGKKAKQARGRAQPAPVVATPAAAPAPPRASRREQPGPREEIAIDEQLAALEAEFVALDAPADAPERLDLLEQLGHTYARLGRRRDAGLCFARAVWELSGAAADERLDSWVAADLGPKAAIDRVLGEVLAQAAPGPDDVRRVAMIAARAPAAVTQDPHRVVRWLDDHDAELDARTLWLARVGLARLSGGDALGLARTRDRILARLAGGLPVERELPSFLRFAGRSGALGNASGEHLARALAGLSEKISTTRRKRSPVEAPVNLTQAYVGFQLAHGYARIGQHVRARALVKESREALAAVAADKVHAFLIAAFAARVDQAIVGEPPEAPLPEPLGAQLAALERVDRYKVDRLREASRILEPLERPDAIGAFSRKQRDARGPEFAALRAITDAGARGKEIARLVEVATSAEEADKARLLDGVFDVLLELPEASAVPILGRAWPLIRTLPEPRRAVLYGEALVVAGHFGRTELVPELLELLAGAVPAVPGNELARVLDQSLRALRRIGLRREIAELLGDVETALAQDSASLQARLALASGLAYLGETARALPILEAARKKLGDSMTLTARLELTRSLAQAYAQAPINDALAGIAELSGQLRDITDSFGTNSHYCLSVLHFVESLVLGIASDDLALGEAGRRFVEDDEHLIRRRLHRDLGGTS
jgi:cellulose synthase operon protein C